MVAPLVIAQSMPLMSAGQPNDVLVAAMAATAACLSK
jgi:hypothetical protein